MSHYRIASTGPLAARWRFSKRWVAGCGCLLLAMTGCHSSYTADPPSNPETVAALRQGAGGTEGGEGGGEVVAATGWGELKGRFRLDGAAPQAKVLSTGGKDAQVCDVHPLADNTLLVGDGGGVQDILVFARKVSRVHESFEQAQQEAGVIDQKDCLFLQQVWLPLVGQAIEIKNSDPIAHNTAISPPGDTPINPLIPANSSVNHKFKRPQPKPVLVTCSIHPWMRSYCFPRKDPYAALSGADGSFSIKNLPAGEQIEFEVWHAAASGGISGGPIKGGKFKLKLSADATEDLGEIAVPVSAFKL